MKHVFFSGIGGTGIGPLALIAKQAGFEVSGSDKQRSQYTDYLESKGIHLYIGQTAKQLQDTHRKSTIDWYVYSSALPLENPEHPELQAVEQLSIKHSKRDEFLSYFLQQHNLKLLAFAGTHGKTSSTAMAIWVAKQLGIHVSYSVGAKISFGDMGEYDPDSEYFIYECDEFDRNFLQFEPYIATLCKVDWDHHEQYPTRQNYIDAFKQFCAQSHYVIAHAEEGVYLSLDDFENVTIIGPELNSSIHLNGEHNRRNAAGVILALHAATHIPIQDLLESIQTFPGSNRRFENISHNIYSDYAHTPEEIAATLQLAREISQDIVVVYEPLTNQRQHFMRDMYKDVFRDISALYWLPSYLARENKDLPIITPEEFIKDLPNVTLAAPSQMGNELKQIIQNAADNGALVLILAGGGGGSVDEWIRKEFKNQA